VWGIQSSFDDRKLMRRTVGFLTVLASLFLVAPVANATHASTPHFTTNMFRIYYDNLTSLGVAAVTHARNNLNPTDVTTSQISSKTSPYIYVRDADYPDNFLGNSLCEVPSSSTSCLIYLIRLNSASNQLASVQSRWNKTACHEFGHTAGLGHRTTSGTCMVQGISTYWNFDQHDKDTINAGY